MHSLGEYCGAVLLLQELTEAEPEPLQTSKMESLAALDND